MFEQCTQVAPQTDSMHVATANMAQESNFWLSSPLITSGTATSSCSGSFRTAGAVDVVLGSHNELHLLTVAAEGRLETVFKQPLFCRVKQLCVLPFSLLQPSNMQTQVLDHLLLLLEGGTLLVLKYSQLVQRFYIAAEAQLATGSPAEPDYLGARMAVSPQPTAAGVTVAVAAKRGRIACLTVSLDSDGSAQLSTPVLYALPALQILGASYKLMKQRELELGNVMDLVVLPAAGGQNVQGQQLAMEHLAVLSHKPDESASELVMFGWSADKQQLRKLGSVPLYNHIDAAGFGMPLRLSAVPKCPTAVVITREWGLLLLECSTLLQQQRPPGHQVERCSMECTQQLAFRFQEEQLPHQQWAHRHHVHCFAAQCVVPSLKQAVAACQRAWQADADANVNTRTAHLTAADECTTAVLTPHAAAAAAPQDDATAGVAAAPEAMDMLPEAAVAAAADPTAGHDFDHGIAWAGQQQQDNPQDDHHADWQAAGGGWNAGQHAGGGPLPLEAAEAYDPAEQIQMPEDTDEMLVDYETEEFAGAPLEPEDAFLDAEAEASAAAAESGSGVTSLSGSGDEDSPGFEGRQETSWPASSEERASVVEATSITAVAWASSAQDCSAPVSSPQHAGTGAAGAVTDKLLVSTSCGCLLQLTVAITPSPGGSSLGKGTAKAPSRASCSCLSITAVEKVYEVSLPNSFHSSRLGPVLLPLPQQLLLLVADEHSQVQLLQRQHTQPTSPAAAAAVQHAGQAAGHGAGGKHGSAVDPAAAATGGGSHGESPGDALAHVDDQHVLHPGAAGAEGMAAHLKQQQHGSSAATPATPAAAEQNGMEVDAGAGAAPADVCGSAHGIHGRPLDLRQVVAALKYQAMGDKQLPRGGSNPAPAAAAGSTGSAHAAQPATAAAVGTESGSAQQYTVVSELQLLGKVGPMVALPHAPPAQQQGQGQAQVAGVNHSLLPVLVAARAGHESGLRVVMPAPQATELSRGPAHMLDGVSGMWPVAATPDSNHSSNEHVAVVFSFAGGASRALSVGVQFQDVTEVLGLQGSAETLLAACVAEGVVAQVTGTGVHLCCLDALLISSPGQGVGRAWRGSPKSSRSTASWQKQQQQQPAVQQQGLDGAADGAHTSHAAAAVGCCQLGSSGSTQAGNIGAAAAAVAAGPPAVSGAVCGMQPSRLAVSSSSGAAGAAPMVEDATESVVPAAAAAAAAPVAAGASARLLLGYSPWLAGSGSSSCSPSMSPQEQHAKHWCLQPDRQQQGSAAAAALVLAAAAAGVVVLYTTTGRLVVLGVTSEQQYRQQQQRCAGQQPLNLEHLDLNSDSLLHPSPSAAAVAGAAAAGQGAGRMAAGGGGSSSGSSGSTHATASKKRARGSWGLYESGSMQLDGQVSCLQVCGASAAASPASPGNSGISSGSSTAGRYIVFVGRYDGSLELLTVQSAVAVGSSTCSIQSLAVFDQQRLLPLQTLASSLANSSSSGGSDGGALSHGASHLTAAAAAVPESCVVLPARQKSSSAALALGGAGTGSAAGAAGAGEALPGGRAGAKRGKGAAAATSAAAGGSDSSNSSSCLQFFVSYRTGDVAAYRLDLVPLLQQQQQQQQQQPISVGESAAGCGQIAAASGACLRVLTQLRLPCITKLQLLPQQPEQRQQQRVLAVGSQVWLLQHDSVTQRVTSCDIACEPVMAAAALSLPENAMRDSQSASHSSLTPQAAEGTELSRHHRQQQQQLVQDQQQDQFLQAAQHMLAVTPSGELQLSALHRGGPSCSRVQVSSWLPYTTVTQLLQHPGSGLLLAVCSGFTSPFSPSGLAGRDLGAEESSWLQALDPCTGAHMAAYEPCRRGGQWLTCMGLWDTPWKPHGSSGRATSISMAAEHWLASSADAAAAAAAANAGGADAAAAGTAAAAAAAAAAAGEGAAGGGRAGWRRPGLGASARWWQRLRQRRTAEPDPAGDVDIQRDREQQEQQQRRHGSRRGPAAAAGAEGSSSGSEHFFQLGSLLKGLDSPPVGSGVAAPKAHSSGRSSQASKAVKQRRGPLVVLGTETFGELDGCSGQVLVLQVMHCSRPGSDSSSAVKAAPQQGSSAVGADVDSAGCSSVLAGTEAGAAGAGSSSDKWGRAGAAAPPAADHTPNSAAGGGSSSSGGSWMLQRVARLRMPDSVTAVAAFNKELLLVATRQVLALYQLKDDQLSKAAYCFVRAPIVSLSAMPAAASLAAASGSLGMVLAADTLMGVTVFQVNLHAATGQYALQPVGSHTDVRQASQVLCLPHALQPPARAAVMKAAALAQASSASLPLAPMTPEQHGRQRTAQRQQHHQQNAPAGPAEHQQQQQPDVGRRGGNRPAPAADDERLKQVQQMMEAGLRGLCLDEAGAVVEFGWARQRNVPAKWLRTTACIPLPGKAANGSLQTVGEECWPYGVLSQPGQWPRGTTQLTQLLPGQPGQQDGLPLHWCGLPAQPARAAAAVVAAAADGTVLHMVRLPAAEGQLLWSLQQLLLRHPLTSNLVLGGKERLVLAEQSQGNVQLHGVSAAGGRPAVGITPRQLGMVDANILRLFLVLPYPLQQLLLDSVTAGQGQRSGGGGSPGGQLLLDGLRCRLQLLSG